MQIFWAELNDGTTIKRDADRMEIEADSVRVYKNGELIAFVDISALIYAQLYEKPDKSKEDKNGKRC